MGRLIAMNTLKKILTHAGLWILAVIFWIWLFTGLTREYEYTLVLVVIVGAISVSVVYFFNLFLIPRFLFTRRYWRFGLLSVYSIIISVWITLFLLFLYLAHILSSNPGLHSPFQIDVAFLLAGMFLVIIAGVLGHVIRENFNNLKEKSALKAATLEANAKLKESELRLLKSQFHPHFLFNTLNNLYALSLKKSDDTPGMILKLSDLLDYSLYGSEKDKVELKEEIQFIQNYLDLIKMRFKNHGEITFDWKSDNQECKISPMMLIPFVENAVKHGLGKSDKEGWIRISLEQNSSHLIFKIENSLADKDFQENTDHSDYGLGLQQIKSRLDILYPNSHTLIITDDPKQYTVKLEIHEPDK